MNELVKREATGIESLRVNDLVVQVAQIQEVMRALMKVDEHYGVIPGTKKPSLLQPGAQKLGLMFRLLPDYIVEDRELGDGNLEVVTKCNLKGPDGGYRGSGVGSASTLESKWRYRMGPKTVTSAEVPREYWTLRKTDPAGAQKLLGGPGHSTQKDEAGVWRIAIVGEKIDNPDPADVRNTVRKMSAKRAFVAAILTATAASDIFTQDVEDLPASVVNAEYSESAPKQETKGEGKGATGKPAEGGTPDLTGASAEDVKAANAAGRLEKLRKMIWARGREKGKDSAAVKGYISEQKDLFPADAWASGAASGKFDDLTVKGLEFVLSWFESLG